MFKTQNGKLLIKLSLLQISIKGEILNEHICLGEITATSADQETSFKLSSQKFENFFYQQFSKIVYSVLSVLSHSSCETYSNKKSNKNKVRSSDNLSFLWYSISAAIEN